MKYRDVSTSVAEPFPASLQCWTQRGTGAQAPPIPLRIVYFLSTLSSFQRTVRSTVWKAPIPYHWFLGVDPLTWILNRPQLFVSSLRFSPPRVCNETGCLVIPLTGQPLDTRGIGILEGVQRRDRSEQPNHHERQTLKTSQVAVSSFFVSLSSISVFWSSIEFSRNLSSSSSFKTLIFGKHFLITIPESGKVSAT